MEKFVIKVTSAEEYADVIRMRPDWNQRFSVWFNYVDIWGECDICMHTWDLLDYFPIDIKVLTYKEYKQLLPKRFEDFKPNEAIIFTNNDERQRIYSMLEEKGMRMCSGSKYSEYPNTWIVFPGEGQYASGLKSVEHAINYCIEKGFLWTLSSDFVEEVDPFAHLTHKDEVFCVDANEAREFRTLMDKHGYKWYSGNKFTDFKHRSDSICFIPKRGTSSSLIHGAMECNINYGRNMLFAQDFLNPKTLVTELGDDEGIYCHTLEEALRIKQLIEDAGLKKCLNTEFGQYKAAMMFFPGESTHLPPINGKIDIEYITKRNLKIYSSLNFKVETKSTLQVPEGMVFSHVDSQGVIHLKEKEMTVKSVPDKVFGKYKDGSGYIYKDGNYAFVLQIKDGEISMHASGIDPVDNWVSSFKIESVSKTIKL